VTVELLLMQPSRIVWSVQVGVPDADTNIYVMQKGAVEATLLY